MTANEALEALNTEYFINTDESASYRKKAFEVLCTALIQAEKDKQELADIKARADKVIFTYALDLVDISNGVKHGDEKPINDFIEAINYILKGETK